VYVAEIEIQTITPRVLLFDMEPPDGCWINRATQHTFKIAAYTQDEVHAVADELLRAFLLAHPGTVGSWSEHRWRQ
jgi:hypothetical protein